MTREQGGGPPRLMEAKAASRMYGKRYGIEPETFYRRMRNWWTRGLIFSDRPPKRRRPVYIKPAEIEDMMRLHVESSETPGGDQVSP